MEFPAPPHGLALALMAQDKRPGTRVLFMAQERYRGDTDGIGTLLPTPATPAEVAEAARGMLAA